MDNIESYLCEVLEFIVDKAIEFKLGARGLRSICEAIMIDAMYEIPSIETDERYQRVLVSPEINHNSSCMIDLRWSFLVVRSWKSLA